MTSLAQIPAGGEPAESPEALLVAAVLAQTFDTWFFHNQIAQQLAQIHSHDLNRELNTPTGAISALQHKIDAAKAEQDMLATQDVGSVRAIHQDRQQADEYDALVNER